MIQILEVPLGLTRYVETSAPDDDGEVRVATGDGRTFAVHLVVGSERSARRAWELSAALRSAALLYLPHLADPDALGLDTEAGRLIDMAERRRAS